MLVIYNWFNNTNNNYLYLERKEKMNYIYDILLNFNDPENYFEFYEWADDDIFEHIKKIPLVRISKEEMSDFLTSKIRVTQRFLDYLKGNTISYKNKKDIKYGCLFCDLNKVIAIEFNGKGISIGKSTLLLDEEEDIIDETTLLDEERVEYEVIEQYQSNLFLTRDELFKRNYLLKDLEYINSKKDYDKFNYLYEEIYPKDKLSFEERMHKLTTAIKDNYSAKFNELFEIIRLTYMKK